MQFKLYSRFVHDYAIFYVWVNDARTTGFADDGVSPVICTKNARQYTLSASARQPCIHRDLCIAYRGGHALSRPRRRRGFFKYSIHSAKNMLYGIPERRKAIGRATDWREEEVTMKLLSRERSTSKAVSGGKASDTAGAPDAPAVGRARRFGKKGASAGLEPGGYGNAQKRKKRRRWVVPVAACLLLIAALAAFRAFAARSSGLAAVTTYSVYAVEKRDITVALNGSGTLKPADSYSVTSLVSGEILSDTFEEGDTVKKGDVLYQIDTADAETGIRSAELNLEKAQLQYDNLLESLGHLRVKAPAEGTVISLDVE
ncbi:MAG: biotin/lipoyl-binding protein, partial [Clostridiales bacterium]|nr:biotin/lipoyl-binding protein [Clostridiales bacterium]